MTLELAPGYDGFLKSLKERIGAAQTRAALAVSRELLELYWTIGRDLETAIAAKAWGAKVIERVARDLQASLPGVEGFSKRNLERMRAFHKAYPNLEQFAAQPVSQLPWGHNVVLLQKLKDPAARLWYAQAAFEHGWSRNLLEIHIDTRLLERQGKAITNFSKNLPPPQSDLAQQILKDPYNFDFLTLTSDHLEKEVERGLLEHVKSFLLELGVGFAFVGSQYPLSLPKSSTSRAGPLEVGEQEFYIDLLFYHLKLRAFVVIELKARAFRPEDAGQLQFYMGAVNALLKHETDAPTIGLILCRSKNALMVEYTLENSSAPIGVSQYQFTEALPQELEGSLPTVAQLEAELGKLEGDLEDGDAD